MAENNGEIDLQEFGEIARDWRAWRQALEESTHELRTPELVVLSELSRTKPMWQLVISSLAYITPQSPESRTKEASGMALEELAWALTSIPGRRSIPRFENVATTISTLPYRSLIRAAPRFSSVLRHAPHISAAASVRVLYCMDRYPEGGPELLRCIAGTSG